jgi:hypothetical protein
VTDPVSVLIGDGADEASHDLHHDAEHPATTVL